MSLDDAEGLQLAEEHEEHGQGHDDLAADGVDPVSYTHLTGLEEAYLGVF